MLPRLVLVEDQPVARDMILDLLSGFVQVVAAVETVQAAIDAVYRHNPDGVLVDVNLNQENGFQVARHLARSCPKIKILLMSAHAESIYAEIAAAIPRTHFVAKAELNGARIAAFFRGAQ